MIRVHSKVAEVHGCSSGRSNNKSVPQSSRTACLPKYTAKVPPLSESTYTTKPTHQWPLLLGTSELVAVTAAALATAHAGWGLPMLRSCSNELRPKSCLVSLMGSKLSTTCVATLPARLMCSVETASHHCVSCLLTRLFPVTLHLQRSCFSSCSARTHRISSSGSCKYLSSL